MNDKYIKVANGKVVVFDEKGCTKTIDDCKNLDEILVQENVVEDIEKIIEQNQQSIDKYISGGKSRFIPTVLIQIVAGVTVMYLCVCGICFLFKFPEWIQSSNRILDVLKSIYLKGVLPFAGVFGGMMQGGISFNKVNSLKKQKGLSYQLDYLKERLAVEKEKLELLKNASKIQNISKVDSKVTDDPVVEISVDSLRKLRDTLNNLYMVGYNEEEYISYMNDGNLDKKLRIYGTDAPEIKKTLVLRKNKGRSK